MLNLLRLIPKRGRRNLEKRTKIAIKSSNVIAIIMVKLDIDPQNIMHQRTRTKIKGKKIWLRLRILMIYVLYYLRVTWLEIRKNNGFILKLPAIFVLPKECSLPMLHPDLRRSSSWKMHQLSKWKELERFD